ncbi:hypothetical protein JCM5353_004711 [Sporobolomyces roseus]
MSQSLSLTPISSLRLSSDQIPAYQHFPNTSIQNIPLLIYHSVFEPSSVTPSSLETHFRRIGIVEPQWRYTMYRQSHFHSTTHELLAISRGRALLCFGGEENERRVEIEVVKGDVVLIPAGVSHRLLEDREGGFEMVGCYPKEAKGWDMCYGEEKDREKVEKIRGLGWFDEVDPVYGSSEGPSTKVREGRGRETSAS